MALSTKQKWFIGCGGCLSVIVLFFAIIFGAFAWFHNNSVQVISQIFGKEPLGYMTILGLEGKDKSPVGMLMSSDMQSMLLATKTKSNPQYDDILVAPDSTDPKALESVERDVQALLSKAEQTRSSMESIDVQELRTVQQGGKTFKLIYAKFQSKAKFFPGVGLLMSAPSKSQGEKTVLAALLVDIASETTDTQADFKVNYKELGDSLLPIAQAVP